MGLVMKKFRYPFFESKMSFFPFICRFITMKTVVIAMTRDFIATKTVVVTYEVNVHGIRRSSFQNSAQLTPKRHENTFSINDITPLHHVSFIYPLLFCKNTSDMIKEYEFRIIKMSLLPHPNRITTPCFWNYYCG